MAGKKTPGSAGSGWTLRRPRPEDARAVCRLRAASIRHSAAGVYSTEQVDAWIASFDAKGYRAVVCDAPRHPGHVAEVAGRVVGFVLVRLGDRPHLWGLYVHPAHRSKGIGQALLGAAERDAAAAGFNCLFVAASENALTFYTALGYTAHGPFEAEVVPRAGRPVRMTAVTLEKSFLHT
jgi:ribosomal protein S18 acetylase RimI-like enzyme